MLPVGDILSGIVGPIPIQGSQLNLVPKLSKIKLQKIIMSRLDQMGNICLHDLSNMKQFLMKVKVLLVFQPLNLWVFYVCHTLSRAAYPVQS